MPLELLQGTLMLWKSICVLQQYLEYEIKDTFQISQPALFKHRGQSCSCSLKLSLFIGHESRESAKPNLHWKNLLNVPKECKSFLCLQLADWI
mmetsp:Transcript_64673/g.119051  ORF Transcript_64673/g.119051 Transcript_64673/m.119051 type:complete len:93 (-) Transcript_64673:18-296(-)